MAQAVASSQTQVIFIPPLHFSILKVQRGTIIMFAGIIGPVDPVIGLIPVIRSAIVFMVAIMVTSYSCGRWLRPDVVAGLTRGMIPALPRLVTPFPEGGCGSVK
jgi:hypothetical protein